MNFTQAINERQKGNVIVTSDGELRISGFSSTIRIFHQIMREYVILNNFMVLREDWEVEKIVKVDLSKKKIIG